MKLLNRAFQELLSLVYPPICPICANAVDEGLLKHAICNACWNDIRIIGQNVCARCGKPLPSPETEKAWHDFKCQECRDRQRIPYDIMRSCFHYETSLAEIIKRAKFNNHPELFESLANDLAVYAGEKSFFKQCDLVAPVPISFLRYMRRGYNQSEILAARVASFLNIEYQRNLVKKKRNNRPQSLVVQEKRKKNVRNAFEVCLDVKGKRILLVDDIVTSGATVEECARIIKRDGASTVAVLTLARARTW
jgi:competence protein ComFC